MCSDFRLSTVGFEFINWIYFLFVFQQIYVSVLIRKRPFLRIRASLWSYGIEFEFDMHHSLKNDSTVESEFSISVEIEFQNVAQMIT